MGRKGLGKLAGFGIARVVEVRTVRSGWLTAFRMDFEKMTRSDTAEFVEIYEPELLADEVCAEESGTTITLRDIQITRPILEESFRESMARRFSILGKGFEVILNDKPLEPLNTALEFSFQGAQDGGEDVSGVGFVKWWIGFTEKPIKSEALRGVSVIVRDKMAQAPFFFDLTGGAYAQHGIQYLTGEVYADQLDQERDFIGTDRQGILWDEPMPAALLKWGDLKIRDLLRKWAEGRSEKDEDRLVKTILGQGGPSVEQRISRLRPREQEEVRGVIRRLASFPSVTDDPNRARELLDLILRAFEDSSFFALLKALSATDAMAREQVLKLITELDVFEVVKVAELVRARVGAIHKFREMLDANVVEKPDLQDFLFNHPWLIHPEWLVVEHERRLESILAQHFGLSATEDSETERRIDFFCVGTRGRYLVVEVKRPHAPIGKAQVTQIIDYVSFLRQQAPASGQPQAPMHYEGVLVGHHLTPDGQRWRETAAKDGIVVRTWEELLDVAERTNREFLDVMRQKVPNDARVQGIVDPRLTDWNE